VDWSIGGGLTFPLGRDQTLEYDNVALGGVGAEPGQRMFLALEQQLGTSAMRIRLEAESMRALDAGTDFRFDTRDDTWKQGASRDETSLVGLSLVFAGRPNGRWTPYLTAGVGYYWSKVAYDQNPLADGGTYELKHQSIGGSFGVGMSVRLGSFSLFTEVRRHTKPAELPGFHRTPVTIGVRF
jgi:hypothetical protein